MRQKKPLRLQQKVTFAQRKGTRDIEQSLKKKFRWENGDSSATVGTSPRLAAASVDVCGSANMY